MGGSGGTGTGTGGANLSSMYGSVPSWITQASGQQTAGAQPTNSTLSTSLGQSASDAATTAPTTPSGGFELATPTAAPSPAAPTAGGTNLIGQPSWMNDFMASGGGDLNAYWQKMQGQQNVQQRPETKQLEFAPPPPPPAAAAAAPAAAAPAAEKTPYTVIPMNAMGGYNQPGMQQPMSVSDMWNGSTGSSQQIASARGMGNAPQIMSGPIYTDNKGGYFSKDPSGKIVPIGQGGGASNQFAADYVKKFFDAMGYGAQT
jgi:hypothetical protein